MKQTCLKTFKHQYNSDYRLKRVEYQGLPVRIILQNENGPCPLIAIGKK